MSVKSRLDNLTCPSCKKPVHWEGNPDRPFCSQRCRQIDLGAWASGEYFIVGTETHDTSDDEN